MSSLENHLLNDFQRDFPLTTRPFAEIASLLGVPENEVLESLRQLQIRGLVSRVGAVFRPHRIGASTLAAMAIPEALLAEIAQIISAYPEVNHNYEREHHYNLWFVATAADENRLQGVLDEIAARTCYPVMKLPMLEDYHIDLGFNLWGEQGKKRVAKMAQPAPDLLEAFVWRDADAAMIAALQSGLPLVSRPYETLGQQAGMRESDVIKRLQELQTISVIKRFGVVVRHHELGFSANAMVVWDIPDEQVAAFGQCIGEVDYVTLCYRRPRHLPQWRYNLFCMIHGKDRGTVLDLVSDMRERCGLQSFQNEVLFSRKRFKQRGAHYVVEAGVAA